MAKRLWIRKAIGRKGALHRKMGVPAGQKIPTARLRNIQRNLSYKARGARTLPPSELKTLRQVNLALTLRKFPRRRR